MKGVSILFLFFIIYTCQALNYSFFHLSDVHFSSMVNTQVYNQSTLCIAPALYEKFKKDEVDDHHEIIGKSKSIFNNTATGLYGRYGCDTNINLFQSALEQMNFVSSNPDFIIYTGDSVGHSLPQSEWQQSQITFVKSVQSTYNPSQTTFIPSIGNNDVFPDYNSQCNDTNLQFLTSLWANWIPEEQIQNFSISGSLVLRPVEGLVVISMNTVLYSIKNNNKFANPNDPCGQLAWLDYQLSVAQENGEQAYIIGHIFPGLDPFYLQSTWKIQYIESFFEVLSEYENVVNSGFFGHIHRDEIRSVIYSNETTGFFPMFIGSSITPVYINNPSVKLFKYDPISLNVTDFTTYYADIYISNLLGKINWGLEYSFLDSYMANEEIESISGQVLNQLITIMQTNDQIYGQYDDHRTSNYLSDVVVNLCLANALTVDALNDCMNALQLVS